MGQNKIFSNIYIMNKINSFCAKIEANENNESVNGNNVNNKSNKQSYNEKNDFPKLIATENHIDLFDPKFYNKKLLSKSFRNLFITIPHTDIDYKTLHTDIDNNFNTKYIITCEELHKDGDKHIHQLIVFEKQQRLNKYHNILASYNKRVGATINYQSPKDIPAVNQYIKKDDKYLQSGNEDIIKNKTGRVGAPLHNDNNKKSYQEQQDNIYKILLDKLDNKELDKEGVIEYLKNNNAKDFVMKNNSIMTYINKHFEKKYEKWDIPELKEENVILKPWQKELWDLIQTKPLARRIIWVKGDYGIGKSFMVNYIEQNYKYGVYNAGQSVAFDNVVYGYEEQGAIIWDIPRNYDWNTLTTPFCNIVEKFSDVGQYLTSKKYQGNKVRVLGHTIVFSNDDIPQQLKHRNIEYIYTDYEIINNKYVVRTKNNTEYIHTYFNNMKELKASYKEHQKQIDTDIDTESEDDNY